MAPKMPAKFDDISKTASSVLGDDFQCKGFQLKSKQNVKATEGGLSGSHAELTTDLFGAGEVQTPTKLSFKFPKPCAMLQGVSVEKLDIDKEGKGKLEVLLSDALHGIKALKLEVKSDFQCKDPTNHALTYCSTYTGLKDVTIKKEMKHSAPTDLSVEVLHGFGSAVIGAKFNGISNLVPSVGVNFVQGDFFGSVIAKNTFSEFTGHGLYKVSDDIKVAATYQQGGKTSGAWALGGSYAWSSEVTAKAKFESSQTLSMSFKRAIAKGTTFVGGMSYGLASGATSYGAKVNIE